MRCLIFEPGGAAHQFLLQKTRIAVVTGLPVGKISCWALYLFAYLFVYIYLIDKLERAHYKYFFYFSIFSNSYQNFSRIKSDLSEICIFQDTKTSKFSGFTRKFLIWIQDLLIVTLLYHRLATLFR